MNFISLLAFALMSLWAQGLEGSKASQSKACNSAVSESVTAKILDRRGAKTSPEAVGYVGNAGS